MRELCYICCMENIFTAVVEKGRGVGKKLVLPTLNLKADPGVEQGVYLCRVDTGKGLYWGLMSHGPKPTFDVEASSVEIFLLDFSGNLYGQKVEVAVYNRLRGIKNFKSAARLKEQIDKDIAAARLLLRKIL